jgi:hypothetical protein
MCVILALVACYVTTWGMPCVSSGSKCYVFCQLKHIN